MGGCSFDSSTRFFENVLEDIHAVATAITGSNGESVLFVTFDLVRAYNQVVEAVKTALSEKTGLPQARIMVTCTHTYSAVKCLENDMKPVENTEITTRQMIYRGRINHSLDHLADKAQEILDLHTKTGDREPFRTVQLFEI